MLKAGQRKYTSPITNTEYAVPSTAVIHARRNRECYISGIGSNYLLYYLDDGSFETIGWNEAMNMMPFTQEAPFKPIKREKEKPVKKETENNQQFLIYR